MWLNRRESVTETFLGHSNLRLSFPSIFDQNLFKYLEDLTQSATQLTSHSLVLLFPCESEALQGLTTTTVTPLTSQWFPCKLLID